MIQAGVALCMWLVRFLIVFASWACLFPAPTTKIDFFRSAAVFTLGMTYDFWNIKEQSKKKGAPILSWFFFFAVIYSVAWFLMCLGFVFGLTDLVNNHTEIVFFPGTPIAFSFSRFSILLCMMAYPFIAVVEHVGKIRKGESVQTISEEGAA